MSATLAGNVAIGANGARNVVVRFFTPDTDTEVFKACAPTDASGDFTIYGCPVGTYDVGLRADGCLTMLEEDKVFTEGNTTDIDFGTPYYGDLKITDKVDAFDVSALNMSYGVSGACRGYAGDWLLPQCPSPPPPGGACYGYVIS